MPVAQSNLLTVNAAGETGAVFPGGIELTQAVAPGGIFAAPAAERRIRWVKEASGAQTAELYSQEWGTSQDRLYLTQGSEVLATEQRIRIRAGNAADAPFDNITNLGLTGLQINRRAVADMPGGLSTVQAAAEGQLRTIVSHKGESDFVQIGLFDSKVITHTAVIENNGVKSRGSNALSGSRLAAGQYQVSHPNYGLVYAIPTWSLFTNGQAMGSSCSSVTTGGAVIINTYNSTSGSPVDCAFAVTLTFYL